MTLLQIDRARYVDAEAQRLIAAVQAEYAQLYGGPDDGPIEAEEFEAPTGAFFLGSLDGQAVATGGWRRRSAARAEIKRMYVVDAFRGQGYARIMLEALEAAVRAEGFAELVLETGLRQPAAVQLYRSSGYTEVEAFGHYADSPLSVYLGKRLI